MHTITLPHRQAFICAHSVSQRRPVTLVREAARDGQPPMWRVCLLNGPIADAEIEKAVIEKEIRKIKPEEYGPYSASLFSQLTAIKKKIRALREKKQ